MTLPNVNLKGADGTREHLYQWAECPDEHCHPCKHPYCWKCVRCEKVHTSGCQAAACYQEALAEKE